MFDWLEKRDDPGTWHARYAPIAIDGSVAVARGRTRHFRDDGSLKREFDNIHFDSEGRCSRFTEWYFQLPDSAHAGSD